MEDKWKESAIADIAEVVGGGTPSTKDDSNFGGSIPWLTPKDLSGYLYRYISHGERNITDKGLANSSARLLPANSVLLTTRAPVGYVAIAKNSVTTNQGFRSLVLRNGFNSEFVYYLLKANTEYLKNHASGTTVVALYGATAGQVCLLASEMCANQACCGLVPLPHMQSFNYLYVSSSVQQFEHLARGSAQQNLSQQIVADLQVIIPDTTTLETFEEIIKPLFNRQILNLEQSRTLAAIRDALLPKLLSREIRVKDAERFAENTL